MFTLSQSHETATNVFPLVCFIAVSFRKNEQAVANNIYLQVAGIYSRETIPLIEERQSKTQTDLFGWRASIYFDH